jgi:transglutaminase-like putative cysteine protease
MAPYELLDFVSAGGVLGMDATTFVAVLVLYAVGAFIYLKGYKGKYKKEITWGAILIPLAFLGVSGAFQGDVGFIITESDANANVTQPWQEANEFNSRAVLPQYNEYTVDTPYYNYDDPLITAIANKIAAESTSAEEAMLKTARFVYRELEYVSESSAACKEGVAAQILNKGTAQCDTMTMVNVAIMRKMGIASTTVGGCFIERPTCGLQSFIQSLGIVEGVKYTPLTAVDETQEAFGRGAQMDRQASGLHAWTAVFLPEKGWVYIESTSGEYINEKCNYYHVETFPKNENKVEICETKSYNYAQACRLQNLASLNQFGLGLTTGVTP